MSKETHVRIAGVCNCEVFEHCAKCDPEYFKNPPPPVDLKPNKFSVTLTLDDILTLRLLRDSWLRMAEINLELWSPLLTKNQIHDTLNRILKQVE